VLYGTCRRRSRSWAIKEPSACDKENAEIFAEANVGAVGKVDGELGGEDGGEVEGFFVRVRGHQFLFVEDDGRTGDARACGEDVLLRPGEARSVMRDFRARADEAHVAGEDVEKLRELVDFGFAEPAAEGSDAGISRSGEERAGMERSGAHGAKFEDAKGLLLEAGACLREEGWAGAGEADGDGNDEQKRAEDEEAEGGGDGVEPAFGEAGVESGSHDDG
jgi:hypothetical protein